MKSRILICAICLLVIEIFSSVQQVSAAGFQRVAQPTETIDREKAIRIANRAARKRYKRLGQFHVVACEGIVLWRIIYDGGGPEYVIDKRTGRIIKVEHLPQSSRRASGTTDSVDERQAVEIAKADARARYGDKENVDQYDIRACEEAQVWRIVFDFRPPKNYKELILPHGSMPQYVIDKASGKILYSARD